MRTRIPPSPLQNLHSYSTTPALFTALGPLSSAHDVCDKIRTSLDNLRETPHSNANLKEALTHSTCLVLNREFPGWSSKNVAEVAKRIVGGLEIHLKPSRRKNIFTQDIANKYPVLMASICRYDWDDAFDKTITNDYLQRVCQKLTEYGYLPRVRDLDDLIMEVIRSLSTDETTTAEPPHVQTFIDRADQLLESLEDALPPEERSPSWVRGDNSWITHEEPQQTSRETPSKPEDAYDNQETSWRIFDTPAAREYQEGQFKKTEVAIESVRKGGTSNKHITQMLASATYCVLRHVLPLSDPLDLGPLAEKIVALLAHREKHTVLVNTLGDMFNGYRGKVDFVKLAEKLDNSGIPQNIDDLRKALGTPQPSAKKESYRAQDLAEWTAALIEFCETGVGEFPLPGLRQPVKKPLVSKIPPGTTHDNSEWWRSFQKMTVDESVPGAEEVTAPTGFKQNDEGNTVILASYLDKLLERSLAHQFPPEQRSTLTWQVIDAAKKVFGSNAEDFLFHSIKEQISRYTHDEKVAAALQQLRAVTEKLKHDKDNLKKEKAELESMFHQRADANTLSHPRNKVWECKKVVRESERKYEDARHELNCAQENKFKFDVAATSLNFDTLTSGKAAELEERLHKLRKGTAWDASKLKRDVPLTAQLIEALAPYLEQALAGMTVERPGRSNTQDLAGGGALAIRPDDATTQHHDIKMASLNGFLRPEPENLGSGLGDVTQKIGTYFKDILSSVDAALTFPGAAAVNNNPGNSFFSTDFAAAFGNPNQPEDLSSASNDIKLERLSQVDEETRLVLYREWRCNASQIRNFKIRLGELYHIYDQRESTGPSFVSWITGWKKWVWPENQRPVGILRDMRPSINLQHPEEGDQIPEFPQNSVLRLWLKNKNGDILFENIYIPEGNMDVGEWHQNICTQINKDMEVQPESNRIRVQGISESSYNSTTPLLDPTPSKSNYLNVFVAGDNSQVTEATWQFVRVRDVPAENRLDANMRNILREMEIEKNFIALSSIEKRQYILDRVSLLIGETFQWKDRVRVYNGQTNTVTFMTLDRYIYEEKWQKNRFSVSFLGHTNTEMFSILKSKVFRQIYKNSALQTWSSEEFSQYNSKLKEIGLNSEKISTITPRTSITITFRTDKSPFIQKYLYDIEDFLQKCTIENAFSEVSGDFDSLSTDNKQVSSILKEYLFSRHPHLTGAPYIKQQVGIREENAVTLAIAQGKNFSPHSIAQGVIDGIQNELEDLPQTLGIENHKIKQIIEVMEKHLSPEALPTSDEPSEVFGRDLAKLELLNIYENSEHFKAGMTPGEFLNTHIAYITKQVKKVIPLSVYMSNSTISKNDITFPSIISLKDKIIINEARINIFSAMRKRDAITQAVSLSDSISAITNPVFGFIKKGLDEILNTPDLIAKGSLKIQNINLEYSPRNYNLIIKNEIKRISFTPMDMYRGKKRQWEAENPGWGVTLNSAHSDIIKALDNARVDEKYKDELNKPDLRIAFERHAKLINYAFRPPVISNAYIFESAPGIVIYEYPRISTGSKEPGYRVISLLSGQYINFASKRDMEIGLNNNKEQNDFILFHFPLNQSNVFDLSQAKTYGPNQAADLAWQENIVRNAFDTMRTRRLDEMDKLTRNHSETLYEEIVNSYEKIKFFFQIYAAGISLRSTSLSGPLNFLVNLPAELTGFISSDNDYESGHLSEETQKFLDLFLPDASPETLINIAINMKLVMPKIQIESSGFKLRKNIFDKINNEHKSRININCLDSSEISGVVHCVAGKSDAGAYLPVKSGDYMNTFSFENNHYIPIKEGVMQRVIYDKTYKGFRPFSLEEEQAGLEAEEKPLYRYIDSDYEKMSLQPCSRVKRSPGFSFNCFGRPSPEVPTQELKDWRGLPEKKYILQIGDTGGGNRKTFEGYAKSFMKVHKIPKENIFGEMVKLDESKRFTLPGSSSLSQLDEHSRLYIPSHGIPAGLVEYNTLTKTTRKISPEQLVRRLWDYGLRTVGVIRIDACHVGVGDYLESMKRELIRKKIKVGYLSAPTGYVQTTHRLGTRPVYVFGSPWKIIEGDIPIDFPGTRYRYIQNVVSATP